MKYGRISIVTRFKNICTQRTRVLTKEKCMNEVRNLLI